MIKIYILLLHVSLSLPTPCKVPRKFSPDLSFAIVQSTVEILQRRCPRQRTIGTRELDKQISLRRPSESSCVPSCQITATREEKGYPPPPHQHFQGINVLARAKEGIMKLRQQRQDKMTRAS
jgi:hypothetical protein